MSQKIDISIISSGANLADARLHRLTRALLRGNFAVEIFAPGHNEDAPQKLSGDQILIIRKPWFSSEWRSKSLLARYHRSRLFAFRARGGVLYSLSPEAVAPSFIRAKLMHRKFAADFFEDYLKVLKDRKWSQKYFGVLGAIARSDTKSALWIAARADLTTVADIQVPPFDARNRLVVRNLPDYSLLTMSGERDATPRAIYIGDLRQSRGLHEMLEVADLTTKWNFDFIGEIAEADREYVERWQVTSPAIGRVRFHGKLPPHEAWAFAKGAWVGLSLLQSTPAFVEAVPSKLYEYMSVGLAIISTPLPRCIEIINESNSGAIASSAKFVSSQLNAWEENPMELDQARKEALLWANEHLDSEQEYATFAAEMRKLTR